MKKDTDKKLVIEQLKKNPLVQIACEKVGVVRATYYRWRKEDSEFASLTDAALLEGRSLVNDLAESQLMSAIKDKNISAIIFWLRNNHPTYANRLEVSGKVSHIQEELTDEDRALFAEALRLALPQKKEEAPEINVEPKTAPTNDQPTA